MCVCVCVSSVSVSSCECVLEGVYVCARGCLQVCMFVRESARVCVCVCVCAHLSVCELPPEVAAAPAITMVRDHLC